MVRSIAAVVAGYLAMLVGVLLLFALWFRDPTELPSLSFMLFSVAWGFVSAMVGGYVTATIAQRSVQRHLVALIGVGLVIGLLRLAVSVDGEPLWHPITNLVVMTLGVTLGGRLPAGRG